jgi:soluble lytic murein transglycosylase-like protein
LLSFKHQAVCIGIAALTGAAFASTGPRATQPAVVAAPAVVSVAPVADSGDACLARALCSLKQKIGARGAGWTPARCEAMARSVRASAARHDLSPALLLAVMVQESDLDETAARVSHPHGAVAKDSGLMGIRCVLDGRGRCTNGLVKGMPWRQVMDPGTNIELGARYLAYYREGKHLRCHHRDHAYWAHYNSGNRYIRRGPARLYPREVAALYSALGQTLGIDTSEVAHLDRSGGGRRSSGLCAAIHTLTPACSAPAITVASSL